ncbi:conserved hypothetical protein [uncultured Paludibacter sp.]|nr:conserved hypothetical protein [uncultured Paludibacter sp.]
MKKFILHSLLFICIMITIALLSLFFIPNKKIVNNSLYANIDKHRRLDSLSSPKIIFVGGSNFAYGVDSKRVEDSLKLSVVNMGLHAGFGLKFMINEVKLSIRKGDIVVLSPEYHHFFKGEMLNGEKVLIALLFDVNRNDLKYLTFSQTLNLIPQTIEYSISKLMSKQMDVMGEGNGENYEKKFKRNSFNKYGDEVMHWNYPNETIKTMATPTYLDKVFPETMKLILDFNKFVKGRGAKLIIIPPAFMHSSYNDYKKIIDKIDHRLKEQNTPFKIKPHNFVFPDTLFFNTIYHLNRKGVEQRTDSIISLLKE